MTKKESLIKSKKEAVNNKYDIREVFYIDIKEYSNYKFLCKDSASCFLAKLKKSRIIRGC